MIYKTAEELRDADFQKWWAHHPWRLVCVNNEKLFHINMMLIFAVMLSGYLALGVTGLTEAVKYKQYKTEKSNLSEKEMKEKYTKGQITRFETYTAVQRKFKQK